MESSLAARLENRARCMLPAETVMLVECAADAGKPGMAALLERLVRCGIEREPLCDRPYRRLDYDDRVLLRCEGCPGAKLLPRLAGVGFGQTEAQARENALYALTLPMDKADIRVAGTMAARRWGEGPVRVTEYSCIYNRTAYAAI